MTPARQELQSANPPSTWGRAVAPGLKIAVVVPCLNEAVAIGNVVTDFHIALPQATIYVYDNNSTDATASIARAAGAIVRHESLPGKGNVLRRIFADVDADIYVLVDGDGTYDASAAPDMVDLLLHGHLDMVTGSRLVATEAMAYRPGHKFGNTLLSRITSAIFGDRVTDVLSGYRVFSRRFVKSFPALATGFETEIEFTIHALDLNMPLGQLDTLYRERPSGSHSKLQTIPDGIRVLVTILRLIKEERPLKFFSVLCALLALLSLALSVPLFVEFQHTHLVPRLPTAVLCTGIMLLAFLCLACGLILDTVSHGRKEAKRMVYLSIPPLSGPGHQ